MAALAKTLLSAVAVTGAGTGQDLAVMARSITMQVIQGGTVDPASQVQLQGSLDNINWFGMGTVNGAGQISVDEDVVQYVRANVTRLASGTITAYASFVSG